MSNFQFPVSASGTPSLSPNFEFPISGPGTPSPGPAANFYYQISNLWIRPPEPPPSCKETMTLRVDQITARKFQISNFPFYFQFGIRHPFIWPEFPISHFRSARRTPPLPCKETETWMNEYVSVFSTEVWYDDFKHATVQALGKPSLGYEDYSE